MVPLLTHAGLGGGFLHKVGAGTRVQTGGALKPFCTTYGVATLPTSLSKCPCFSDLGCPFSDLLKVSNF